LDERKVPPIEHAQKLVYSELRPATRARFDAFGQDAWACSSASMIGS